jgi:hypothetical protein
MPRYTPTLRQVTLSRSEPIDHTARKVVDAVNAMSGVIARVIEEKDDEVTLEIVEEER